MIISLLLAAASPQIAGPSAVWSIEGPPGAVRTVTGKVKTGGRIVADGFVNDQDSVADEKESMSRAKGPQGTCARAADARSFTRLRRFAADGRLLWEWNVKRDTDQALRFLGPSSGDCLSPDGGRLLVSTYGGSNQSQELLGRAVVAVDRRPRFVDAKGRRTGEEFGTKRITTADGWRKGGDATLVFSIAHDEHEQRDVAVLGRRP